MILVERVVDGRDLALAEGVVERRRDAARRHAEPGRGVAVDGEVDLQAALLLVGIDVGDDRRVRLQRLDQLRPPGVEVGQRIGLQGELVLGVALAAADPDVLHRLQEEHGARHLGELAAAGARSPGRPISLRSLSGFRVANRKPELVWKPPVKPATLSIAGSARMISMNWRNFRRIAWNEMLWSARMPPTMRPVSCCGKKPLGIVHVEVDVEDHGRQEDQHGQQRMAQHQPEAAAVAALQGREGALAGAEEAGPARPRHRARRST